MFYSNEILGRRSPLGAIWIAAHGKRLNRSKILSVDIVETCNTIMDPEIPQALRLQGILIGGIVIIFNKQQHYLLDDCNDVMRKVQGLSDHQRAATTLTQDKIRARPERITLQGMDFMGLDDEIAGGALLEEALQSLDDIGNPVPGADLFVMPSLEHSSVMDILTPGRESMDRDSIDHGIGLTTKPNHRTGLTDIDFDAALTLDQPERFDGPEMDMDLPDMNPEPFMQTPPAAHEGHPALSAHGLAGAPCPMDMDMPDCEEPEAPAAQLKSLSPDMLPEDAPPDNMPLTPPLTEEDYLPPAAQGCKRGKRKGHLLILDDAEHVLLDRSVYREWTRDREPILTERPKRTCPSAPAAALFELLPSAGGHAWAPELLSMLQVKTELPTAQPERAMGKEGSTSKLAPGQEPDAIIMDDEQQWPEDAGVPEYADEHGAAGPQEYPQMEEMADADMPGEEELQAVADEEGLPVEQLRAVLETPQAAAEQLKALQQEWATGSSKHSGLETLLKRRARSSSKGRSTSASKPATSDRSLGSTVRRLSDVREDDAAVDQGIPAGDLDALLPDLPEAEEPAEYAPGLLTQFQQLGDSLMEATERQTQPTPHDSFNKHTLAVMNAIQRHFHEQDDAPGSAASLSVHAATAGMTRRHAAKFFYQICAVTTLGFVAASQEEPYGDIILTPGPMYGVESF
ncbi:hypothetical protein CVIRNUC_000725 [Coccomyxa viridis]|uniref:Uncharacterized protein n=1 Tax=Coccomyxa viridis TaxID=1274662 RepID=A0AAV1HR43_9CHLO|nr:hypothetical protein CVIRNUC_000725 [Coccomyxa viridis]